MPSLDIHIAIARKYLTKYGDIKDESAFIKGTLDPDLMEDRMASHYTKKSDKNNLSEILKNKIGLKEYLNDKNIINDYEKGYFLHLISDFIFFNSFFDKSYIEATNYANFKKNLYYSYNIVHDYLITKYDISYHPFEKEIEKRIDDSQISTNFYDEEKVNIIPYKKLDKFINKILEKDICTYLKDFEP